MCLIKIANVVIVRDDKMKNRFLIKSYIITLLYLVGLLMTSMNAHSAVITLNYGGYETSTILPSVTQNGVTVTGSGSLYFLYAAGMGIAGGLYDDTVDYNSGNMEYLEFNADGSREFSYFEFGTFGVYNHNLDNNFQEILIEGFDKLGNSIGSFNYTNANTLIWQDDLVAKLGVPSVDRLRIASVGDGFRVGTVDVQLVPIPPALYLFGSGLLGLIGIVRRKKMT